LPLDGASHPAKVRVAYDDALYVCFSDLSETAFQNEQQQAVIYLEPTVPSYYPKIYRG